MIRRYRLPLRSFFTCLALVYAAAARASEPVHHEPAAKPPKEEAAGHAEPAAVQHADPAHGDLPADKRPAKSAESAHEKPLEKVAGVEKPPAEKKAAKSAVEAPKAAKEHAATAPPHGDGKSAHPEKEPAEQPLDETQGLLKLAASLTERADYESAEIAFRQILNAPHATVADVKTALLGLAHMHRRQGAMTKAVAIYERFLKDYPGDDRTPDAYLDLGRTLRSMGVHKLAIARFYSVINSTLKLPSDDGFARYQLLAKTAQFEIAETHFQAGDFAEAAKFFSRLRLLDLAPADRARATFKSAYSLKLQGNLEDAVSAFNSYISQWPDDENVPEARYLLATSLRELKRPQEAFRAVLDLLHAEKSRVAADPKRWAYWQRRTGNQLANDFFEVGDMLNAHAIYSGLVELSNDPNWRLPIVYQIGLCYERLGLADRARTSYQSIIDGAGTTPSADLAELAKMSTWRLENLAWRDQATQKVASIFESSTPKAQVSSVTVNPTKAAGTEGGPAKLGLNP